MKKSHNLKLGDSVIVKTDIKDNELGIEIDMGGWQGRISEIIPEDDLICIDWDSITLQNMPGQAIALSEEKGFEWNQYYLKFEDVEPAPARDKKADVEKIYQQLQTEHAWDHLGLEGQRIRQVLAGIDPDDERKAFKAWNKHLQKVLQFPFEAEASEFQEHGALKDGDKVVVEKIIDVVEEYGIMVQVKHEGIPFKFPLGDLEATDKESTNHDFIQDYAVWFSNQ